MIEETLLIWSQEAKKEKDKEDPTTTHNRLSWREQRTRDMISSMRTLFLQQAFGQVVPPQVTKHAELAQSTTVLYGPVHKYSHN